MGLTELVFKRFMSSIAEIEESIFALGGVKLEYDNLIKDGEKYFHDANFTGNILPRLSPCGLLYNFTGQEVPEECFYAYYYIPTDKPQNYQMFYKNIKATVPKEVLLFLGSHDKITADYICPLFPPYISAGDCDQIMSKMNK